MHAEADAAPSDELANFICQTPFNKLQEAANVLSASLGNYETCEFLSAHTLSTSAIRIRMARIWSEQMRILLIEWNAIN